MGHEALRLRVFVRSLTGAACSVLIGFAGVLLHEAIPARSV